MVVAAYGSGKSLASGVGGLLVENARRHRVALQPILDRLERVDQDLAKRAGKRVRSNRHGLVLVLHGYVPDMARTLAEQAQIKGEVGDVRKLLTSLRTRARRKGIDRIAIIWDEFGRHLEGLVADGRTPDLMALQDLAEWVARQSNPRATLTLLLHQNFLNYAGRLNQTARYGWRKIEGRFTTLRFVDDSRELYELIARVVAAARPQQAPATSARRLGQMANLGLQVGWYGSFPSVDALKPLFADAWPLSPAALYVLPLLSARVAQNERSVFSFLDNTDLSHAVGLEQVYTYFAEAMRCDTGLGGTHRRWLEAESARGRASNALEREILAAACLLQLGTGGERRRLPRATLVYAASAGTGQKVGNVERSIDDLLKRKLLLHRLRNDDISIWHGADVDIRSRVDEEKARLQAQFDLATFLSKECPPPFERPLRHNVERGVGRFWTGCYVPATDLISSGPEHPVFSLAPGMDGRLVYAIPETGQHLNALRELAERGMPEDPGIVLVVPDRPLEATDAALELAALINLHEDQDLLGTDPLVLPELKELTAVAREYVHKVLAQLTDPVRGSATYFTLRRSHRTSDGSPLSNLLSELADARFPGTPRLLNEHVVRHRITRPIVNARKKVVLGILERTGTEHLGFGGMTTPDASIYRTVVHSTGLYCKRARGWSWASPREVRDEELSEAWTLLRDFFAEPEKEPKPVGDFVDRLLSPPYGLRRGVLPILFSAGLRAFGRALAIRGDGSYLPDILATDVETICAEPERFTVHVVKLTNGTRTYLEGLVTEFGGDGAAVDGDLVRAAFDGISTWKAQLPAAALSTDKPGDEVRMLQVALRTCHDPLDLLFERLLTVSGASRPGSRALAGVAKARRALEEVVDGYTAQAVNAVGRALTVGPNGSGDILLRAKTWADCVTEGEAVDSLDLPSRGLLARARDATNGHYTEASFALALSTILLGRGFEKWDDRTCRQFDAALRTHVDRIERAAIENGKAKPKMAPILESRIERLVLQLQTAVGTRRADQLLDGLRRGGTGR